MNQRNKYNRYNERLARWDDFRTMKWINEIKYLELLMRQVEKLLAT